MAVGGCGQGAAPRRSDIAVTGEYLSSLRVGSVGKAVAPAACPWRCDYRALRGRQRGGVQGESANRNGGFQILRLTIKKRMPPPAQICTCGTTAYGSCHEGALLSEDEYKGARQCALFRCREGHVRETLVRRVIRGAWCATCGISGAARPYCVDLFANHRAAEV